MQLDEQTIRITLLISLSILLLAIIYKRLIRQFKESMPIPHQAWLMDLKVAYHPQRLLAEVQLPLGTEVGTAVLDTEKQELQVWPESAMQQGDHTIERETDLPQGTYFFRISTKSQNTLRRFQIKTN